MTLSQRDSHHTLRDTKPPRASPELTPHMHTHTCAQTHAQVRTFTHSVNAAFSCSHLQYCVQLGFGGRMPNRWVSCYVTTGVRGGARQPYGTAVADCDMLLQHDCTSSLSCTECYRTSHWRHLHLLHWRKYTLLGLHMLAHCSVPL